MGVGNGGEGQLLSSQARGQAAQGRHLPWAGSAHPWHLPIFAAARPGLCPRRRVLPTGTPCPNRCEDDRGCPPGQKCCFTGCGLECLRPRAGSTSLSLNSPPTPPHLPDLGTRDNGPSWLLGRTKGKRRDCQLFAKKRSLASQAVLGKEGSLPRGLLCRWKAGEGVHLGL